MHHKRRRVAVNSERFKFAYLAQDLFYDHIQILLNNQGGRTIGITRIDINLAITRESETEYRDTAQSVAQTTETTDAPEIHYHFENWNGDEPEEAKPFKLITKHPQHTEQVDMAPGHIYPDGDIAIQGITAGLTGDQRVVLDGPFEGESTGGGAFAGEWAGEFGGEWAGAPVAPIESVLTGNIGPLAGWTTFAGDIGIPDGTASCPEMTLEETTGTIQVPAFQTETGPPDDELAAFKQKPSQYVTRPARYKTDRLGFDKASGGTLVTITAFLLPKGVETVGDEPPPLFTNLAKTSGVIPSKFQLNWRGRKMFKEGDMIGLQIENFKADTGEALTYCMGTYSIY
jgi:hypothetical protein